MLKLEQPKTWYGRAFATLLCAVILCAGGVVAHKYGAMTYEQGKDAWNEHVAVFAGEALDRRMIAEYADHIAHPPLPKGSGAKISLEFPFGGGAAKIVKTEKSMAANANNAVLVNAAGTVGVGYSGTLYVGHLDNLLIGMQDMSRSCGVSAAGASMSAVKMANSVHSGDPDAPPVDWASDEQAAWNVWHATIPAGQAGYRLSFLYYATVGSQRRCMVFGYCDTHGWGLIPPDQQDKFVWCGPTSWSLPFTASVTNIDVRVMHTVNTSEKYTTPRRWTDCNAAYQLFTSTDPSKPTTLTQTLGDMSYSQVVDCQPDANGVIDPQNAGGFLNLGIGLSVNGPRTANLSYCEVQNISCLRGGMPFNLHSNFQNPYATPDLGTHANGGWVAQTAPLSGAIWNCFNTGSTLKLQWTGYGGPTTGSIGTVTKPYGPVRFNVQCGRFGRLNSGVNNDGQFPFASTPQVDVGLTFHNDDGTSTPILLSPGLSPWYSASFTTLSTNDAIGLPNGQYSWGAGFTQVAPVMHEQWLEDSGELLVYQQVDDTGTPSAPPIDNRRAYIQVASAAYDPATSSPVWGPAINYDWQEISTDIPPGKDARPSLWTPGSGATVDPDHNELWTITGDTGGQIQRTLLTRHDARMNYLANVWVTGMTAYDPDWPIIGMANHGLDADPASVAAACAIEDVTNYDNSRILQLSFLSLPEGATVDWTKATLTLTYAMYSIYDPCYQPDSYDPIYRFGANGDFTCDTSTGSFTFTGFAGSATDNRLCHFDLAALQRSNTVDLRHVRSLLLNIPVAGDYQFADLRLIKTPDATESA